MRSRLVGWTKNLAADKVSAEAIIEFCDVGNLVHAALAVRAPGKRARARYAVIMVTQWVRQRLESTDL